MDEHYKLGALRAKSGHRSHTVSLAMAVGVADSRLVDLLPIWEDNDRCLMWCQELGLVPSEVVCDACHSPTVLLNHSCADNWTWRCPKRGCQKRISLRRGTIFENSKLSISKALQLLYWWSRELPVVQAAHEVGVSPVTAVDWFLRFREICADHLIATSGPIGGAGHVVEIDESKFGKRKYNRGRLVDGAWVFGGVDRETNDAFLQIVEERSAESLLPIIQRNILPGTTVHSDEWAAYHALGAYGYHHLTVNHSLHFVDPGTGADTQRIESLWSAAKSKLKRIRGTSRDMLPTYLVEFLWRRKFGKAPFDNIIQHMSVF